MFSTIYSENCRIQGYILLSKFYNFLSVIKSDLNCFVFSVNLLYLHKYVLMYLITDAFILFSISYNLSGKTCISLDVMDAQINILFLFLYNNICCDTH